MMVAAIPVIAARKPLAIRAFPSCTRGAFSALQRTGSTGNRQREKPRRERGILRSVAERELGGLEAGLSRLWRRNGGETADQTALGRDSRLGPPRRIGRPG